MKELANKLYLENCHVSEKYIKNNYIDLYNFINTINLEKLNFKQKFYCLRKSIEKLPTCEICGNSITKFTKRKYDNEMSFTRTCSSKCYGKLKSIQNKELYSKLTIEEKYNRQHNRELIMLKKFGVKNNWQRTDVKNKIKNNLIKKYNIENIKQKNITNIEDFNDINRFELICIKLNYNIRKISQYFNSGMSAIYVKIHKYKLSSYIQCQSHYEVEISDLLTELNINFKRNDRTTIKPLELDFYLPDYKLAIEFNGSWFHSINSGKLKNYHQEKSKVCQEKGIRLIHIYEDEWNNSLKQKIIKDILLSALGLLENRIYARKCIVKEIDSKSYKQFCEYNHLQGYRVASIRLGLFYNDELVQIASFSKSKHHDKNFEYEWIRGCPASNSTIIGGTSKLWKYFIKKYNPKSVLCYADFNKFDGKGYKECGFDFIKLTSPDKFYIDNYGNRINRNPTHYKEYKELVNNGELLEIHGAGSLRFEFIR